MRLVQIRVSNESQESVLDTLDEANADYVIADEAAGKDSSIVHFPIPDGAVDEILDRLRGDGLEDDAFTIVSKIETATTPSLDELEGQYTQGPDDEVGLSHAELRTKARELTPQRSMFIVFAMISSIVASAGLLLNSAIVITGAMVISPFAGSSLSASVGGIIGDYESIIDSFKSQLLGLTVAIIGATAAAFVFRWGFLVPPRLAIENIGQVGSFTAPGVLTLMVAIFAGAGGALALATDLPVSIAGVAVAAAIVPAAAAVGLGIVWLQPLLAIGALVLLLINVILINITAYIALWGIGYRSTSSNNFREIVSFDLRTVAGAVGAVVVALLLVGVLISTYQYFIFTQTVNQNVDDVLSESEYSELKLEQSRLAYGGGTLLGDHQSDSITVVVGRSSDTDHPELSKTLQQQITADTSREVTVQVRFLDYQQTPPPQEQ
ncbi:TIGR00341 family protein [Saliphagus infecundisoli]|uniref:TIGR00341 family protein n=1 Tax=Saliphagus infecundisoli TaxID=1849069 RepID=A0ABD5Q925_9EURY|nr:TIGR00341 family protein [Saliphagus infecundisoli]